MLRGATTKARAISSFESPTTVARARAALSPSSRAGWQHAKSSRKSSSLKPRRTSGSATAMRAHGLSCASRSTASPWLSMRRARRCRSRWAFCATVTSHASGESGRPAAAHHDSARSTASWTASSASGSEPVNPSSFPRTLGYTRRIASACAAPLKVATASQPAVPRSRGAGLDNPLRALDGLVLIIAVNEVETDEPLLRLDERTVRDRVSAGVRLDGSGSSRFVEPGHGMELISSRRVGLERTMVCQRLLLVELGNGLRGGRASVISRA